MNLKHLSNSQLEIETRSSAKAEQQATLLFLEYLAEVDVRMLYAERGYSSLWQYVHRELKYSESQTTERVSSMRLMRKMPEVKTAIENQSLSMTSTAKIASFLRKEKPSGKKAQDLIAICQGKSTREVESILLAESSLPVSSKPDVVKAVSSEITRISFDADPEMMQMIALIREQNVDPNLSLKDAVKIALHEKVAQLQKRFRAPEVKGRSTARASNSRSRYISKPVRAKIYTRASVITGTPTPQNDSLRADQPRCEYIDSKTLKRCDGMKALQFDHVLPFAQGGQNVISNLQLLCPNHNRLRVPSSLRFVAK